MTAANSAPVGWRRPRDWASGQRLFVFGDMAELIAAYTDHCRANAWSANTVKDRCSLLRRVAVDLGHLHHLTRDDLERFLATDGWSAETKATYYGHLRSYYRWAVDTDRLGADPMAKMRKPKVTHGVPRPALRAVFERILAEARDPYRLAALLAGYAGLRAHEIGKLRREDVTEQTITICGKGNKLAAIPTHPLIWAAVRDRPPGLLVCHPNGRPTREDWVCQQTGRHLRRIGIDGVTLHPLRHLYATTLLHRGADIRTVQELMRHASLATTQRYLEVTDERKRAAIGLL